MVFLLFLHRQIKAIPARITTIIVTPTAIPTPAPCDNDSFLGELGTGMGVGADLRVVVVVFVMLRQLLLEGVVVGTPLGGSVVGGPSG